MTITATASYYSASADIGRVPPRANGGFERHASHYSASAVVGRAVVRHGRDVFAESGIVSRRTTVAGSALATAAGAYEIQRSLASGPAQAFIAKITGGDIRSINNQSQFLSNLRDSLSNLSARILDMQSLKAFNPNVGNSQNSDVVNISPAALADVASYNITIEQLAISHQVASDQQTDPYAALGYSGTITINGYSITVATTDTLADIRDAINFGEDLNGDGILQTETEDGNGNGTLDTYYQPAQYIGNGTYLPAFIYSEDRNNDGVLDGTEDANDNGVIDGGTDNIGAKAFIEDTRLIIRSTDGASKLLRIDDPDSIMFNLGFFKEDNDTRKILKTSVDNSTYFKDQQEALFTIDGTRHTSYSNKIENVISKVTLELLDLSSSKIKVTVSRDPSNAVNSVVKFTSAYNDVIRQINNETIKDGILTNNQEIQYFADSLARDTQKKVAGRSDPPQSLHDLGVELARSGSRSLSEGLINSLGEAGSGSQVYKSKSDPAGGIVARLGSLGILSHDDFTLTIDKDKLSKELKKNPKAVFEVFSSIDEGVGNRILSKIADAIGAPYGIIDSEIELLKHFSLNPGVVARLIENIISVTKNDLSKSTLGGVVA